MAKVVTQNEIMKFRGMEEAFFPIGTIVTPSAKDWAKEQNIKIIIGSDDTREKNPDKDPQGKGNFSGIDMEGKEKTEIISLLTKSIKENMDRTGHRYNRDELVEIISRSLRKMGHEVEK